MTLLLHIDDALLDGVLFRVNKNPIIESIRIIIPNMPESVACNYWFGYASDRFVWEIILKELNKLTFPRHGGGKHNTRSQTSSSAPETNPAPDSDPQPRLPPSTTPLRRENTQQFKSPMFEFNIATLVLLEAILVLDIVYNHTRR